MIHLSGLIWLFFIGLTTFGLFHVKHSVQSLDRELITITKKIDAHESAIGVLKAEWSYLNRPQRLEKLALQHFGDGGLGNANYPEISSVKPRGVPLRKPRFGETLPAAYQPHAFGASNLFENQRVQLHNTGYQSGMRAIGTPDIIGNLVDAINQPNP